MPPLERENDTYREFFSINYWQELCTTKLQRDIIQILADSIPNFVKDEILGMRSRGEVRRISQAEDSSAIPLLAANLKEIIQMFQNSHEKRLAFRGSFPAFRVTREKNIEKLRKIGRKINSDRFNVNVSKVVGTSTGIIGGLLLAGGTVATFLTGGLAAPMVATGLVLCGGGGATTFGAASVGLRRLLGDVKRANAVIKEDKANFQPFTQWLQQSLELQGVLWQVMEIDVLQRAVDDFGSVLRMTFRNNGNLEYVRAQVQAFVNAYLKNVTGVQSIAFWTNVLSLIVGFVFAVVSIHDRNPFVFDAGFCGLRVGLGAARLLDVGVDATVAGLSLLRGGGGAVAQSVGRVVAHSSLAVLGLALDTVTLVLTSIDINKGSVSGDSVKIIKAADELEEDLVLMATIYDEL